MGLEQGSGNIRSGFTLQSPLYWLSAMFAAGIVAIGLLAVLEPLHASNAFGIPVKAADAVPWICIAGVRDIALGVVLGALLLFRERRAAGLLILLAIVIPVGDACAVLFARGVCYQIFIHGTGIIFTAVLGLLLLRR